MDRLPRRRMLRLMAATAGATFDTSTSSVRTSLAPPSSVTVIVTV